MSVASPFPCIKIPNPSSSYSSPSSCSSSSSSSLATSTSSSCFRFSTAAKPCTVTIRSSQAEGPVSRPVAPPLSEPTPPAAPTLPLKPPVPPSPVAPPPKPVAAAAPQMVAGDKNVITSESQRLKARELQDYFKQKKLEEADQGPFFGFLGKNEIANGRWARFGFAVRLLTEYATGSDFVDQVKILLANFGIINLE